MKKNAISMIILSFIMVFTCAMASPDIINLEPHIIKDELSIQEIGAVEQLIRSKVIFDESSELFSLQLSKQSETPTIAKITLNLVGMSSYLDLSELDSNFDLSKIEYESDDNNVAIGFDNRILATGVGHTTVLIKYEDLYQIIDVTVEQEIPVNLSQLLASYNDGIIPSSSGERNKIVERAADMVYLQWRPTKNLRGWRGFTFTKDKYYWGIPYSQTWHQVNAAGFSSALNKSDFYDNYSIDGIAMPKYGNDCSGFVSFAWNIGRKTTYNFYNEYPWMKSYADLQRGDAVVFRRSGSGHIFLIIQNWVTPPSGSSYNEPYVVAYEQTPNYAQLTFHTYRQLTNGGYKPISKF